MYPLQGQEQVKAWACIHAPVKEWLYKDWFQLSDVPILLCASVTFPFWASLLTLVPQYGVQSIVKLNSHRKYNKDVTVALLLSDMGSSKKRMQLKTGKTDQITSHLEANP